MLFLGHSMDSENLKKIPFWELYQNYNGIYYLKNSDFAKLVNEILKERGSDPDNGLPSPVSISWNTHPFPLNAILLLYADILCVFKKDRSCIHDLSAGTKLVEA